MILNKIKNLTNTLQLLESQQVLQATIEEAANAMVKSYKLGGKALFCGNGGSAAQAQHLAAELSGRFYFDRDPIPAEACHVNSSFMTAVSNDYDFTKTYARYIESVGAKGDVLIGLSTSGNSQNIVQAFQMAKQKQMITVALTGKNGGEMQKYADYLINVPSNDVPRIQEVHLFLGHYLCEIVEKELFRG